MTDTEGGDGGFLSSVKGAGSKVWNAMGVKNTAYPNLQLGLGALGGGIGNLADGVMQGKKGWALVGDTALGAVTGAFGDSRLGDACGIMVGFASGAANSLEGDVIYNYNHELTSADGVWALLDVGLGAGENRTESDISNTSPSADATVGNSVGVLVSGEQGAACGGLDSQFNGNC